jgi:hypothetical protein
VEFFTIYIPHSGWLYNICDIGTNNILVVLENNVGIYVRTL